MHKYRKIQVILIVGASLAVGGCKVTAPSNVAESVDGDPADDTFTSDLPQQGRSLFDQIFATAGNTAPFPFEKLLAHLNEKHDATPAAVLIPHGRSLQRNAADAMFPRIVTTANVAFKDGCPSLPQSQVLIGYAEKAESLEVISYNERDGRFEFQIVKDYAEGKQPKVFYAKRTLCTSCHQQGRPIFSRRQWSESNIHFFQLSQANAVSQEIKDARPGETHYHGVKIHPDDDVESPLSDLSADDIDRSVVQMNFGVVLAEMWKRGCGSGEARTECRGLVLRFALQALLPDVSPSSERGELGIDPTSSEYLRLRELWNAGWPAQGIVVPEVIIANRTPGSSLALEEDADPLFERPPSATIKADGVTEDDFTPVDFSFPQFVVLMDERSTPNRMILHLRNLWLKPFEALATKIAASPALVDQVVASNAVKTILAADTAPNLALVNGVLQGFGLTAVDDECFQSSMTLPDPQALNGSTDVIDPADGVASVVGLFQEFCGACHADTGEETMDFLAGETTEQRWAKLKSRGVDIVKRLRWESEELEESERMPAPGPLRKKLMKPERSADRFKMIGALLAD